MADETVVNNPGGGGGTSGGAGVVIGAALVLLVLAVVLVYAMPYVREQFESMSNPTIQVELPANVPIFPAPAPTGTTTAQ